MKAVDEIFLSLQRQYDLQPVGFQLLQGSHLRWWNVWICRWNLSQIFGGMAVSSHFHRRAWDTGWSLVQRLQSWQSALLIKQIASFQSNINDMTFFMYTEICNWIYGFVSPSWSSEHKEKIALNERWSRKIRKTETSAEAQGQLNSEGSATMNVESYTPRKKSHSLQCLGNFLSCVLSLRISPYTETGFSSAFTRSQHAATPWKSLWFGPRLSK